MLSADKVNEIFCIADDFCKEFDSEIEKMSFPCDGKKHRRRKGQMSNSEIMTILICFHFNTYRNFKHYYLCYVKGYLKSYFPKAVSYNRFVELESRVAVQMALFLELFCFGECTDGKVFYSRVEKTSGRIPCQAASQPSLPSVRQRGDDDTGIVPYKAFP